ncbi:unnamed protein product [Prorocentrum cordatum]|uniref:t-SNARE coiled-coil homology domain-containing protein n=1 Tax=Prorocentrum cordatum TaxID=2364126 RepID=A0ABN9XZK3_9DINO|nr:unnamed protein product [Polarella glacialis]
MSGENYYARQRVASRQVDQRAALFGSRGNAPPRGSKADHSADREALERQNDAEIGALAGKVERLGDIARGIGKQVKDSNSLLGGMAGELDKAGTLLKGTMNQLKVMMQQRSGKHMCYMVAFVLVLFFLMYLLRGMGKRLGGGGAPAPLEIVQNDTAG